MKIDFLEYMEIWDCIIPRFQVSPRNSRNYLRHQIIIIGHLLQVPEFDFFNNYYIIFTENMSIYFYCSWVEQTLISTSDSLQIKLTGDILYINYDCKLKPNSEIEFYIITQPCQTCINFMQMFPEDCYDPKLNEIKMKEGPPLLL